MDVPVGTVLAAACAVFVAMAMVNGFLRRARTRLPPGPRGLPLLANIFDMPTEFQWLTFSSWAKTYGEIMSVRVLGHTIVILDSARAVHEVLVKRGAQTAGRMRMHMLEYSGWENNTPSLLPDKFKTVKRFMTKYLGLNALPPFLELADEEITACIRRILSEHGVIDPEDQLKRMAGSLILRIAYGYKIESDNDDLVDIAEQALAIGLKLTNPGWILDTFPSLRFLPDWMLGPIFVKTVSRSRALVKAIRTIPINFTKKQMEAGTAAPSLAAELLSLPEDENSDALFAMLADLYIAGIDTTVSTGRTLLLILALYPEVQAKGQREVDDFTHRERLPTYSDRPHLPYVSALVKELYRFRGVANLAIPHRATQEMEYNGYSIPEDAVLIPNLWSIFHDETKYPRPSEFSPERYLSDAAGGLLESSGPDAELVNEDPTRYVFGFGSRLHHPGPMILVSSCSI